MTDAHGVARDQLRAFIERIERLEEEKKTIADDIKDVYGEAKGFGYDTKAIRTIIRLRKKDANERAEEEAVLDAYMAALGMIDQHDLFDEAVSTAVKQNTRSPAMALQSPRKAAEAVSERVRNIQPAMADEMQHPGSHPIGNPKPALAAANRHNGDDGMVRMARTEAAAVTDRRDDHLNSKTDAAISRPDATPHRPETENRSDEEPCEARGSGEMQDECTIHLPANSEIDPSEDREEGQSPDGGLSVVGANTGGDHVNAPNSTAATAGALVNPAPAIKHRFRPNCQHREHCRSGTVDHCHSCKQAMRGGEAA